MRWKPAKAFLLDERGALIHEFALDPACPVSVQDAYAAGAFAALGGSVRVGRLHAQTVRGNGLALTVLSAGAPEADELELLRYLMGRVQERFEDRVKDRLDLARREEARLGAMAADVRARARGVDGLRESLGAALARMAAEADAMAIRSARLTGAEASVAAREAELAEREAALQDLAAKSETVGAREAEASRREDALLAVEKALREREAEFDAREREGERFFEELAEKVAKNARWERDLARKAESLKAREERLEGGPPDAPKAKARR